MNLRTANNRRKNKIEPGLFRFRKGSIFHSCSLHPCVAIKIDTLNDNIEGKSLLDGTIQNCSLHHCGPFIMTSRQIREHKDAWKREGERGLLILYYGSEQEADQFIKNWR